MMRRMPADEGTGVGDDSATFRTVAALAHELESSTTLDEVARIGAHGARAVLDARWCVIDRVEQTTAALVAVATAGAEPDPALRAEQRATNQPTLARLVHQRTGWLVHVDGEGTVTDEMRELRRLGVRSALGVPILVNGRLQGQLRAARAADRPGFTADDLAIATVIAALVAGAIARVDLEAQVRHLVDEDPLTGLANRRAIDRAAESALRSGEETCVVMCDVDGLKRVNDELGHDAGDQLLRTVADVLRRVRDQLPGSVAGRIGGDEFCVVTSGVPRDVVMATVADVLELFPLPNGSSISYGIASALGSEESPRSLFRRADAAQYQAKRARAIRWQQRVQRETDRRATVQRVLSAAMTGIAAAPSSAVVARLSALAGTATESLGGGSWAVLAAADADQPAAVARGGAPSVTSAPLHTITVSHGPWTVQVEALGEPDADLLAILQTLVDVAVLGAH